MIDVGIVGLDSSHPEAFAELIDDRDDSNVVAVWDGGDVRGDTYVDEFCKRYEATRYEDPSAMIDAVDTAMVLTVNWDSHRELAVPFLDAGVATFIDKPIAGTARDVEAIAAAANGTPLFGGSAVPFHPSLTDLPVGLSDRSLYCAGYDDPFYYGAHLVDTVRLLAGTDWESVTPTAGPGLTLEIEFSNAVSATLRLDGSNEDPLFGVLDVGTRTEARTVGADETDFDAMYSAFVDAYLAAVAGERADGDRLVDGARLLLALRAASESGTRVTPDCGTLDEVHANGDAFLADYSPYY